MLYNYYFYKNAYSDAECDQMAEFLLQNPSAFLKDRPGNGKSVHTHCVETNIIPNIGKFLYCAEEANKEIFGYEIYPTAPKSINCNVYSTGNEYPYHRDASLPGMKNDIKLTVIMNISTEPYTGGELEMFVGENKIVEELNQRGTVLVFPSIFYHRVLPVTTGNRISMSAWWYGPNFK